MRAKLGNDSDASARVQSRRAARDHVPTADPQVADAGTVANE
jgi:hypothetical protein